MYIYSTYNLFLCCFRCTGIDHLKTYELAKLALLHLTLQVLPNPGRCNRLFTSPAGVRGAMRMVTWLPWASTAITFCRKDRTCQVVALCRVREARSNLAQWPKSAPKRGPIVALTRLHTSTMTLKQCPSVHLRSLCTARSGKRIHLLHRPNGPAAVPSQERATQLNPFTEGVPSLVPYRYRLRHPSALIRWVSWPIRMILKISPLRRRPSRHPIRTCNTGSTPLRLLRLSANDSTTSFSVRELDTGQLAPIRNSLIMESQTLQLVAPSKINALHLNMVIKWKM